MKAFAILALTLSALSTAAAAQQKVRYPTTDNKPLLAEIYKPEGPGPFPTVIVFHDCGGVDDHVKMWSRKLVSWGYVAIAPDSFGSRNKGNLCKEVSTVNAFERVQDAINTAKYLATLPYVQKNNIGALGFSHGGWSIMKGVQQVARWSEYGIKGAVAIYPYCTSPADRDVAIPLLILIGENDDWTPAESCRDVVRGAQNPRLIDLVVYPNTYHSFDRDKPTREIQGMGGGSRTSTRKLEYNASATRDAEVRTKRFFDSLLR